MSRIRLKVATVLCSALFFAGSLFTWFHRSSAASRLPPTPANAMLICSEPAWDFGNRRSGDDVQHEFILENTGPRTISIHAVRASCGCTKATIGKAELAPGETASVTAFISLVGIYGRQVGSVYVESSDPTNPLLQLRISGVAESELEVVPGSIFFGDVTGESTVVKSLTVKSRRQSGESIPIVGVVSDRDCIVPKIESQSDNGTKITVAIVPPISPGRVESRVRIQTTSKAQPEILVPVSFQAVGELVVAPSTLTISRDPSIRQTKHFVIRPGKTKNFQIVRVETPFEGSEVLIAELTPGSSSRRITLSGIRADRLHEDEPFVRIVTDLPVDTILSIPINVVGQP